MPVKQVTVPVVMTLPGVEGGQHSSGASAANLA